MVAILRCDDVWNLQTLKSEVMTLYQRLTGKKLKDLSPKIQAMHLYEDSKVLRGSVEIKRGDSLLAKVLSVSMRLPKTQNNAPMTLEFTQQEEKEVWARTFGTDKFSSIEYEHEGQMVEQMSLMKLYFDVSVKNGSLITSLSEIMLLGIKIPKIFTLNIKSKEEVIEDEIHFKVEVSLPKAEKVIEYFGIIKE